MPKQNLDNTSSKEGHRSDENMVRRKKESICSSKGRLALHFCNNIIYIYYRFTASLLARPTCESVSHSKFLTLFNFD